MSSVSAFHLFCFISVSIALILSSPFVDRRESKNHVLLLWIISVLNVLGLYVYSYFRSRMKMLMAFCSPTAVAQTLFILIGWLTPHILSLWLYITRTEPCIYSPGVECIPLWNFAMIFSVTWQGLLCATLFILNTKPTV